MSNNENCSPDNRSIGCVKWYGGHDSKKDRDNKFGFLDCAEHGSVFVHESGLICLPSDMEDGRWVTFRTETTKKGLSAIDVDVAEKGSDIPTILKLLENKNVPIKTRMRVCFNIPLEVGHPLLPILGKTIAEHDRLSLTRISDFPDSWNELNRVSPLYSILPEEIRRLWFNRQYPDIKSTIEILSNSESLIKRNSNIYNSMSPQDKQLSLSWAANNRDYDKAKMLSARGAELVVADYYTDLAKTVVDIAIHQVTGESDHWKSHDLLIDSENPVDVKNARSTINSDTFVEYTIKRFKQDSQGRNVTIVGVLSPYLTLIGLEKRSPWERGFIIILGSTTQNLVQSFEREYSKGELTVDFGDARRWPIWIFNNDLDLFSNQRDAIAKFLKCANDVNPEDWNDCQLNVIPAFLIGGKELPKSLEDDLLKWQRWYLKKLIEKSRCGELTLPSLYLFTFRHFLDAITNIPAAESKQYSPDGYIELLFYSKIGDERPATLIDPLQIMKKLIETLNTLWNNRHSARLGILRRFSLQGEGLLRGRDPCGNKVSVLAYCGGFVEGKGKCGHSPLIIGENQTCSACRMLICDKCGHCSNQCKIERKEDLSQF